jgi:hypothetical protein
VNISPKTLGATAGAGGSTPFSIVLVWLIGQIWPTHPIPPEVATAIGAVIAAAAAFVGGYLPHSVYTPTPAPPAP